MFADKRALQNCKEVHKCKVPLSFILLENRSLAHPPPHKKDLLFIFFKYIEKGSRERNASNRNAGQWLSV